MTKISDKRGVQVFVNRLKQHEITHVVISPGSRNAPLTISFSEDAYFTCFSIPDERSAAFYALGMAEMLKKPVVLLCTSGSAVLNYYPAVSESFYRSIPLIVVSADRPLEMIDQGDGQTIRQEGVLHNHILAETTLSEDFSDKDAEKSGIKEIDSLVHAAKFLNGGGPVHFNFPLEEPLYNTVEQTEVLAQLDSFAGNDLSKLDEIDFEDLKDEWNTFPRKLIICGQMPPNNLFWNKLNDLANDSSVAVLIENTSNGNGRKLIQCIDRTLNSISEKRLTEFVPDLLISFGGAVISKRIKAFLRKNPPKAHWRINQSFPEMNTYGVLSHSFQVSPSAFLSRFLEQPLKFKLSRFGEQWKQLDYLIQDKHFEAIRKLSYSDMQVFDLIMDTLPENAILHMANSSVVRYCQLFDPVPSIEYYSNRGTSGIDGSTSTAIGSAIIRKEKRNILITGDISFFYDSNALWNNYLPKNLRIVLINNEGGGIFKIIPGPSKSDALENFFVAKHGFSAEYLCKAFNVKYMKATSFVELEDQLSDFYYPEEEQMILMEVFTPSDINAGELKKYFELIRVEDYPKL